MQEAVLPKSGTKGNVEPEKCFTVRQKTLACTVINRLSMRRTMVEECPKVPWSSAASTMGKLKLQVYVCLYYLSLMDICKYFAWIGSIKCDFFLLMV